MIATLFMQVRAYVYGAVAMVILSICAFAYWEHGKAQYYMEQTKTARAELELAAKKLKATTDSLSDLEKKMQKIRSISNADRQKVSQFTRDKDTADWSSHPLPSSVNDWLRKPAADTDKTP